MATVYVQFEGEDKQRVVSVLPGPQDPHHYPNQSEIDDFDVRYLKFISPPLADELLDPLEKLKQFLRDNPDVAEIIGQ